MFCCYLHQGTWYYTLLLFLRITTGYSAISSWSRAASMADRVSLHSAIVHVSDVPNLQYPLYFVFSDLKQYCQWESFNATCERDEVILMVSAKYGRMRYGGCVKENHGHIGCSADVISHLDRTCSGRQSCVMSIPDAELHQVHACPNELMAYLEAKYTCVKGTYHDDVIKWKHIPRYWPFVRPVPGEFPSQRPVTRSFDIFFDLHLNKWLIKQFWGWWFET